jgi:hypothetical protein
MTDNDQAHALRVRQAVEAFLRWLASGIVDDLVAEQSASGPSQSWTLCNRPTLDKHEPTIRPSDDLLGPFGGTDAGA